MQPFYLLCKASKSSSIFSSMNWIRIPSLGFKVYTSSKIFGKNFNQNQARDDEIVKLSWSHTSLCKCYPRLNMKFLKWPKNSLWHDINACILMQHSQWLSVHSSPNVILSSTKKWNLTIIGMWKSLKSRSNFKEIPMLELLDQLINEFPKLTPCYPPTIPKSSLVQP